MKLKYTIKGKSLKRQERKPNLLKRRVATGEDVDETVDRA
jgi:hypothetical protein